MSLFHNNSSTNNSSMLISRSRSNSSEELPQLEQQHPQPNRNSPHNNNNDNNLIGAAVAPSKPRLNSRDSDSLLADLPSDDDDLYEDEMTAQQRQARRRHAAQALRTGSKRPTTQQQQQTKHNNVKTSVVVVKNDSTTMTQQQQQPRKTVAVAVAIDASDGSFYSDDDAVDYADTAAVAVPFDLSEVQDDDQEQESPFYSDDDAVDYSAMKDEYDHYLTTTRTLARLQQQQQQQQQHEEDFEPTECSQIVEFIMPNTNDTIEPIDSHNTQQKESMTIVARGGAPTDPDEQDTNQDAPAEQKQTIFQAAQSKALRPFIIISISYLLFTVTDGAIRMIVLLHAYNKNFSALQVAMMFTLYELAGVVTNLAAGLMGARWGIRFTLICGLILQLVSYGLLFGWQDDWSQTSAIVYVTVAQMFAGVAKDLTKLGGKTVTKLVTPEEKETQLFKLVSLLTGWKNSLKGVGYFLGSALLQISYEMALIVMMGFVVAALPFAIFGLDTSLGTAKKSNASWTQVFKTGNTRLNILSLARLFLFASRDFWFEVPLPFFLRSPSCDGLGVDSCLVDNDCTANAICDAAGICQNLNRGGGCGGLAFPRTVVGAFLGGYIILYGQVQSWTPQLVTGPLNQTPPNKLTEVWWGLINCLPTLAAGIVLQWMPEIMDDESVSTSFLVSVIISFAIVFAINSSIHSFLVVNYASTDKVAVSVGFYYMSNAVGRLFGTMGSGLLYTYVGESANDVSGNDAVAGLAACFFAGTCSSFLAALITTKIDDQASGLKCGCLTLVAPQDQQDKETEDNKDAEEMVYAKTLHDLEAKYEAKIAALEKRLEDRLVKDEEMLEQMSKAMKEV